MTDHQAATAKGKFNIQIDRERYVVNQAQMTGSQLRAVPPTPIPADRDVFEVVPGHPDRTIDEVVSEGGMTCVLLRQWSLPAGFDRELVDLLLRLSPGYPDVHPDMWWFDPPVRLADGRPLPATEVIEQHLGRSWQRWSRHFNNGQWRSGVDGLETYLALIRQDLERSVPKAAV